MGKKLLIRRDDTVEITTGVYAGARGRVLRTFPRDGKVVVEGVNVKWKHVRRSQRYPRGGRIEIEAPIDASNVMLICPNRECERFDRPVRIRNEVREDGTKARRCVRCGAEIPRPE